MISQAGSVSCKVKKNIHERLKRINVYLRKRNLATCLAIYRNGKNSCTTLNTPLQRRTLFTTSNHHGVNVRPMTINSRITADRLIRDMTEVERERLSQALQHLQQEFELENQHIQEQRPTTKQLLLGESLTYQL